MTKKPTINLVRKSVKRADGKVLQAMKPLYATDGANGADIYAFLPLAESMTIEPDFVGKVPTGLSIELPQGYGLFILPRSGRGGQKQIIPNAPGLIDMDYRGELIVQIFNQTGLPLTINHGERIAQVCILEIPQAEWLDCQSLSDTVRGENGLGSTKG